jgi:hypothetical protein
MILKVVESGILFYTWCQWLKAATAALTGDFTQHHRPESSERAFEIHRQAHTPSHSFALFVSILETTFVKILGTRYRCKTARGGHQILPSQFSYRKHVSHFTCSPVTSIIIFADKNHDRFSSRIQFFSRCPIFHPAITSVDFSTASGKWSRPLQMSFWPRDGVWPNMARAHVSAEVAEEACEIVKRSAYEAVVGKVVRARYSGGIETTPTRDFLVGDGDIAVELLRVRRDADMGWTSGV